MKYILPLFVSYKYGPCTKSNLEKGRAKLQENFSNWIYSLFGAILFVLIFLAICIFPVN
jgi:signal peptidase I